MCGHVNVQLLVATGVFPGSLIVNTLYFKDNINYAFSLLHPTSICFHPRV
jgi:hypothetical protein